MRPEQSDPASTQEQFETEQSEAVLANEHNAPVEQSDVVPEVPIIVGEQALLELKLKSSIFVFEHLPPNENHEDTRQIVVIVERDAAGKERLNCLDLRKYPLSSIHYRIFAGDNKEIRDIGHLLYATERVKRTMGIVDSSISLEPVSQEEGIRIVTNYLSIKPLAPSKGLWQRSSTPTLFAPKSSTSQIGSQQDDENTVRLKSK
jgi:hypothetical protein